LSYWAKTNKFTSNSRELKENADGQLLTPKLEPEEPEPTLDMNACEERYCPLMQNNQRFVCTRTLLKIVVFRD
jgi:hypothetical protein